MINTDDFFVNADEVAVNAMDVSLLLTGQAILVGSRRVLKNLPASTDYDYMMIECEENRQLLESSGYKMSEMQSHYMDIFTSAIYKKENTQVTLKFGHNWQKLINFWKFMANNPKMFKRYVWKSSVEFPKDGMTIKDFIEDFVPKYGSYLE